VRHRNPQFIPNQANAHLRSSQQLLAGMQNRSRWTDSLATRRTEVMAKNKEEYENGISLRVNMTTWRFVGSRHEHSENLPSKDIVLFAEAGVLVSRLEAIQ
jgi:hypothetical protein